MNFAAFERAQVAAFAYREARQTGSLDCLRAVCFVLRNRKQAHWGDGTWLSLIASHHLVAANFDALYTSSMGEIAPVSSNSSTPEPGTMVNGFKSDDRLLQMIVRDVDDIYLGQESYEDRVRQVVSGEMAPKSLGRGSKPVPLLYYSFVNREPRPWFIENIIRKPQEHPQRGQVGTMMFYE